MSQIEDFTTYLAKSDSGRGVYTVALGVGYGSADTCTCLSFKYGNSRFGSHTCKHVVRIQKEIFEFNLKKEK